MTPRPQMTDDQLIDLWRAGYLGQSCGPTRSELIRRANGRLDVRRVDKATGLALDFVGETVEIIHPRVGESCCRTCPPREVGR